MIPTEQNQIAIRRFEKNELQRLDQHQPGFRLSLYMPLNEGWTESNVGEVLLRDLRRQALKELTGRSIDTRVMDAMLAPLDQILEHPPQQAFHGKGMAILATQDAAGIYYLPEAPPPGVFVDVNFHLEPLLPCLFRQDRFFLLCLSQNQVQLWEGDALSMKHVALEGAPNSFKESLHKGGKHPEIQFHTNTGSPSRNNSKGQGSSFYGASGQGDDRVMKEELLHFFRLIDKAVKPKLNGEKLPLILAGVDYLLPIYREANTYAQVFDADISGNPEGPSEILHAKAYALMAKAEEARAGQALSTYRENLTSGRTASGFSDLVPVAYYKGLTHLFIRKGSRQWGTFAPDEGKVSLSETYRPGAVDLVDLACARTLLGNGRIYSISAERMPEGSDIAGLCRD